MLSLSDAIPSVDALLRRAKRPDSVKPTAGAMQRMQAALEEYGYRNDNPEVYSAICSYGALMFDGTNYKGLFFERRVRHWQKFWRGGAGGGV